MRLSRCGRRNGKSLPLPCLNLEFPLGRPRALCPPGGQHNSLIKPFPYSTATSQTKIVNPTHSYNEMLFMIDTCQANTLFSRFYSPNIIATGSSAIDQSSYSHHADNDVGVAVIDRYTYYNLDFLESQVTSPRSKLTLGNLFDSYDERKIHSQPGIRWDLFPGGEEAGRERLVMDFFGNVQGVEIGAKGDEGGRGVGNESEWKEDLRRLGEMWRRAREREREDRRGGGNQTADRDTTPPPPAQAQEQDPLRLRPSAVKIQLPGGWAQNMLGAVALAGCAMLWGGAWWLEGSRGNANPNN